MNESSNITAELDQADEEILNYTVSDEALEAAVGSKTRTGGMSACSTNNGPIYCC